MLIGFPSGKPTLTDSKGQFCFLQPGAHFPKWSCCSCSSIRRQHSVTLTWTSVCLATTFACYIAEAAAMKKKRLGLYLSWVISSLCLTSVSTFFEGCVVLRYCGCYVLLRTPVISLNLLSETDTLCEFMCVFIGSTHQYCSALLSIPGHTHTSPPYTLRSCYTAGGRPSGRTESQSSPPHTGTHRQNRLHGCRSPLGTPLLET